MDDIETPEETPENDPIVFGLTKNDVGEVVVRALLAGTVALVLKVVTKKIEAKIEAPKEVPADDIESPS